MFETYSLKTLSTLLAKREITANELFADFQNRIAANPAANAYITVVDDHAESKENTALAGIPFAAKDNFCTKGVKTTCGSKMLSDFVAPYDATAVAKLKASGMILLGKNNMDEFGMGSTGEHSAFGAASFFHAPNGKRYLPGGSSSGGAAAVKEGLTTIALGSDTGGSVRQPAALCGLYGYKPTYGGISRSGLISFAPSMDTPGLIAKSIEDIRMVSEVLFGSDAADATSIAIKKQADREIRTIALPEQYLSAKGVSAAVRKAILKKAKSLEQQGYRVEPVSMPMTEATLPAYYTIACAEAAANLSRFDGVRFGHRAKEYTDIADLMARSRSEGFGDEVKRRIMMGNYVLSAEYYEAYYQKAMRVKAAVKAEFDTLFGEYDLILTPTVPTTARELGAPQMSPTEMYAFDLCTVPVSLAGLPAVSMPVGTDENGLSIGMQLIASTGADCALLAAAERIDRMGR